MNQLEQIVNISALMHQMVMCFEEDFTLGVTDRERFLSYQPGETLNFGISPHDPIKEGSLANTVMAQGRPITKLMDASVYGVAYIAGGLPIVENGAVIGSIVFGVSLERQNKLSEISEHLSAIVQEVSAQSQVMQHGAEVLLSHSEQLFAAMNSMMVQVKNTFSELQSISAISKRSDILGLNASIEAARAGGHGRGFNIVAQEMRRLATMTGDLATKISQYMAALEEEINSLTEMVEESRKLSQAQTQGIAELATAIQDVTKEAMLVQQMAQIQTTA